tara:strand:+ start:592 stop:708 length:117 start_codon:yes stop_codon:yes gene_type:complete
LLILNVLRFGSFEAAMQDTPSNRANIAALLASPPPPVG